MIDIQAVVKNVKEPLRPYNFLVELPSEFGNAEKLKYQVLSVNVPSFVGFDVEEVLVAPGFVLRFPKAFKADETVTVEFWEDEQLTVWKYFTKWRDVIVDLNERSATYMNYRLRGRYVRDVYVLVLDTKGVVRQRLVMTECYPISMRSFDFKYGESALVTVEVEFAYKYIRVS